MTETSVCQVLGIGSACMDILIPVNDAFLQSIAAEKGGSFAINDQMMDRIISQSKMVPQVVAGGSSANAIKGLAQLGVKCAFMSTISTDPFGKAFLSSMQQVGIIPFFSTSIQPSARVLCMVTPDGQRTMRFSAGCSFDIPHEFLHLKYFEGVKLVHLEAYTLRCSDFARNVMELAKKADAKVSIDLSSFEIVKQFRADLYELLPKYVDIVFANTAETEALTGLKAYEGCYKLQEICSIAVVMMGKEGCLVGHKGTVFQSAAVSTKVIDTTGAGDLFASGFLYGFLKGEPLPRCAQYGNLLASAVLDNWGAELSAEKWKFLRNQLFNPTR